MDWLRRVSETNGALYVICLPIQILVEQNEESETKQKIPPPLPAPSPPCAAGVASRRPGARWPKPARSGPGEAIRGGPGRGPGSGPAAGRPRRLAIRIRPADVRSGCRAPPGGRFYIVSSLRSSGDRAKGRDLAAVPGEALRAAGVTGRIVPVVPRRRRAPVRRRLEVQVSEGVTAGRVLGCPVVSTGARRCPAALGEPEPKVDAAEERVRGRDAPVRPAGRPAGRPPVPASALAVAVALYFFFPRVPLRRRPPALGPRGMARPGGPRARPMAPAGGPRSLPRGRSSEAPPREFSPRCPDRETLTAHRARACGRGGGPRRVCVLAWDGVAGGDSPESRSGGGDRGRALRGGAWRARGIGAWARAGSRPADSTFPSPVSPLQRPSGRPFGVGRWSPVRRRRLRGAFPLTPPPRVPLRRRGSSWRPLPAPARACERCSREHLVSSPAFVASPASGVDQVARPLLPPAGMGW